MIAQKPDLPTLPKVRIPLRLAAGVAWSVLWLRPRSMRRDSGLAITGISPRLAVTGAENIPPEQACLLVCNHYSRPGFAAWWIVLAISAALAERRSLPGEMHWVMTAGWTFPNSPWRKRWIQPLTRWAFARVGVVYDFIVMPPMPPAPEEVQARAAAVLRAVRLAKREAKRGVVIGLAPEGRDFDGGLGEPPPGAGEFISLLVKAGLVALPAGVYEQNGRLWVSFGAPFMPQIPAEKALIDREVSRQVMAAIGAQLPGDKISSL